ncbi:MAG: hypothetical protein ACXWWR_04445 [Candidatus Limnocylindrales bacterium]
MAARRIAGHARIDYPDARGWARLAEDRDNRRSNSEDRPMDKKAKQPKKPKKPKKPKTNGTAKN